GQGALANARHEFAAAATDARAAQRANAYFAPSYGVLTDALTQLGDYPGATAAAQKMLNLKPGISSFTRASYDLELHGKVTEARRVLIQALGSSSDPGDQAYCHTYLGELAFSTGDLDQAESDYAAGLALAPDDAGLLLGRARMQAARGDTVAAVTGYQHVVDVRPLPGSLVEYGQLLESLGRTAEAKAQLSLFTASEQLFAANGVQDSLTAALLAADDGDGAAAVAAGTAEYATRQNIDAADALGWALHAAGRDAEAMPYAQQATRLGTQNASFLYHRGMIEAGVGDTSAARATLTRALDLNPYFSPLSAPRARAALAKLGGPL
ncbi:MAG: tetratricopeptide repeat protein, partial [Mycobacteriaceae bacterium]